VVDFSVGAGVIYGRGKGRGVAEGGGLSGTLRSWGDVGASRKLTRYRKGLGLCRTIKGNRDGGKMSRSAYLMDSQKVNDPPLSNLSTGHNKGGALPKKTGGRNQSEKNWGLSTKPLSKKSEVVGFQKKGTIPFKVPLKKRKASRSQKGRGGTD